MGLPESKVLVIDKICQIKETKNKVVKFVKDLEKLLLETYESPLES